MSSLVIISSSSDPKKIIAKPFFNRTAELVAPDLIGCRLVKREADGQIVWGVIVETEAYSQIEPACHGYKRRTPANETLFGDPGRLYIYLTYGIYHCVNIVTDRKNFASGVLIRSIAIQGENERIGSGPGLLAKRFGLTRSHDNMKLSIEQGMWFEQNVAFPPKTKKICTTRVGISKAEDLQWRWYLQSSRSISKRAKGDPYPPRQKAWEPSKQDWP